MVPVDVLLAANLAVLGVLAVGDRCRQRRPRPIEVLAMARHSGRTEGRRVAVLRAPTMDCGVVIPFDDAARRHALQVSKSHRPSNGRFPSAR